MAGSDRTSIRPAANRGPDRPGNASNGTHAPAPTEPGPRTLDQLVDDGIAAHQAWCADHGFDWQARVTQARIEHGDDPARAAFRDLVHDGRTTSELGMGDQETVGTLVSRLFLNDRTYPDHVWALGYKAAVGHYGDVGGAQVAGDPSAPTAVADQLAASDKSIDQCTAARHPNLSVDAMRALLDRDEGVRIRLVGRNQPLPTEILDRLVTDPSMLVRMVLAEDVELAPLVGGRLANDPELEVRQVLAVNPGTPADVLDRLADDTDPRVAARVAKNRHATPATFARLATHPDPGVRASVAGTPEAGQATLRQLSGDRDEHVALQAAGALATAARMGWP